MKRLLALALMLALFWTVMSAMASNVPGSAADPLVTLSYMRDKFTPMITAETVKRANTAFDAAKVELEALITSKLGFGKPDSQQLAGQQLVNAVNSKITDTKGVFKRVNASQGQVLNLRQGSSVMLISGSAKLSKYGAADMTTGADINAESSLAVNHEVIFINNGGSLTFPSAASLLVNGGYAFYEQVYTPKYTDLAEALKEMGLLRGTGSGFALERPATRIEALYMMLYLMGEIDAAEQYSGTCPFTDVPDWAKAAVAYSYAKGYTKGVSESLFGSQQTSTPDQYCTMLLRVMGYDDSNGDFSWDQALSFTVQQGIYTEPEQRSMSQLFYRDQMVYVSYYALDAWAKGNSSTLQQTLISRGVLSKSAVDSARAKIKRVRGM